MRCFESRVRCDRAVARRRLRAGRRGSRALLCVLGLFGSLASGRVAAAPDDSEVVEPWHFSLSLGMVAQAQDVAGAVDSSFAPRDNFEPSVEGDPVVLVPAIPIGLRLAAPRVALGSRRIAPFVHGRLVLPMDEDRSVVRQGTIPNPVEIPADLPASLGADSISGQGSLLRTKLDLSGQVGVGLSFDATLFDAPSRVDLSLDYYVQEMSLDGEVVYVTGTGPNERAPFTVNRLDGIEAALFHFVGPRAEVGVDVWREGRLQVGVFAELGVFFAVGDRSKSFAVDEGGERARFELEIDPWLVQAGVGVRLSWRGVE